MVEFLVCYGTGEGQTARVASRIGDALRERGHRADLVDLGESGAEDVDVDDYDAVTIGASIHGGAHQPAVSAFADGNRAALAAVPTAFFQVSLSSATEEYAERAAGYVESFLEATGLRPDRVATFGGALRYSEFGFLKRLVLKRIAKRELPDTPVGEDVEFTDWDAVDTFANDFAAFAEGRLGVRPPESEADESRDPAQNEE